jgi:hypothetical protein
VSCSPPQRLEPCPERPSVVSPFGIAEAIEISNVEVSISGRPDVP